MLDEYSKTWEKIVIVLAIFLGFVVALSVLVLWIAALFWAAELGVWFIVGWFVITCSAAATCMVLADS